MADRFKRVNYEEAGKQTVTIDECLPADDLARFIVAMMGILDLSAIYAHSALVGGEAFASEIWLGLLFYGYATGVFISLDGSKNHADASKSKAVSYGRLLRLEARLQAEVEELIALGEQADQDELPDGLHLEVEVAFRQERLVNPSG